jgi:hypothetical protein
MTMIEKVALALQAWEADRPWTQPLEYSRDVKDYFERARAALEAMREPTLDVQLAQGSRYWEGLIDAALTEPSSSTPAPSRSE